MAKKKKPNLNSMLDLQGHVAVVTGGSGFLCSAMAKSLAQQGAKVAVLARHAETLEKVVDDIKAQGGEAIAVVCDVLSADSCSAAEKEVAKKLGATTILVNGA
ncbi:MAG TPA: SDR family NAD(P)-dependent oxidoreductase, partial [Planctomycetota bacterium]|nr:SDR family NAD(P)-dependent oxidoreductase [Planctomycetota bacterium]